MSRSTHPTKPRRPRNVRSHLAFRPGGGAAVLAAALFLAAGARVACAQNELFVTNAGNNSVMVYARTANGNNVFPLRTISGPSTGLSQPLGLAVDTVHNELAVVNEGTPSITVYRLIADGDEAPLRTIRGGGMNGAIGLALDTANDELAVVNQSTPSITFYDRTASGNVPPKRILSGAATGLNQPFGLAVDTVNNELAVTNIDSVTVYARTASGNAPPLRTISGAATGLNSPQGLAVDTVNDELAVANFSSDSVTVYHRTDTGNVAPVRTLSGATAFLYRPHDVAVNTVNDELAVVNSGYITVYHRTDTGNVAPQRTISIGGAPYFLAVIPGPSCPTITLSPTMLPAGTAGAAYTPTTLTPTAGTGPYTFSVSGLPVGMTPTGQVTGASVTIAGTPTATFSGTITASGMDANNCPFGLQNYTLTIVCSNLPEAITAPLQVCPLSAGNTASVPDAGPGAIYAWTISNGTITAGAGTSAITFDAMASGSISLDVTVTNGSGCVASGSRCVPIVACGGASFYAIVPCRLINTRSTDPPALFAGDERVFVLADAGTCGIPSTATAVAVNVVAVAPTDGPGFLRIYPAGTCRPATAAVNYNTGKTRANNAIVTLGPAGDIAVVCQQGSGTTDLIIDVYGYFQ